MYETGGVQRGKFMIATFCFNGSKLMWVFRLMVYWSAKRWLLKVSLLISFVAEIIETNQEQSGKTKQIMKLHIMWTRMFGNQMDESQTWMKYKVVPFMTRTKHIRKEMGKYIDNERLLQQVSGIYMVKQVLFLSIKHA